MFLFLDDLRDIVGDWERSGHRWMGAEDEGFRCSVYRQGNVAYIG